MPKKARELNSDEIYMTDDETYRGILSGCYTNMYIYTETPVSIRRERRKKVGR
jgi:hypothetical protein